MSDLTWKQSMVCHVNYKYADIETFPGLSKGPLGCDMGLKYAKTQFRPSKGLFGCDVRLKLAQE